MSRIGLAITALALALLTAACQECVEDADCKDGQFCLTQQKKRFWMSLDTARLKSFRNRESAETESIVSSLSYASLQALKALLSSTIMQQRRC